MKKQELDQLISQSIKANQSLIRAIVKSELKKLFELYFGHQSIKESKQTKPINKIKGSKGSIAEILLQTANDMSKTVKTPAKITPELQKKIKGNPMASILQETMKDVIADGGFIADEEEDINEEISDDNELDD